MSIILLEFKRKIPEQAKCKSQMFWEEESGEEKWEGKGSHVLREAGKQASYTVMGSCMVRRGTLDKE